MDILIAIVIILLIAAVIHYVVTAFLPIEARIKTLILLILWVVAIIAILNQARPYLGF